MAKRKTPVLRAGLTVDELMDGTWMAKPGRYTSEDENVELVNAVVRGAIQGLIDQADSGERVTRRTITNTLCAAADQLKGMKDHINEALGKGKFTPTVLDELANI